MYRLEFSSAGGRTASFDEQRVVRIGRSRDNDVVLDSPSISRRHGELRPTATGWDLVDIGSTGGTWIDDRRVSHVSLGATTTVRFGAVSDGVAAFITIAQPHTSADAPPDDEGTAVISDQQRTHIYGHGQSQVDRPVDGLLIRTRDGDKRFDADKPVRIGRDARSDLVADDAAVSRHHANVGRRSDGWWFVDHSNSGSFIDGERVKEKKFTEQTVVQLGHPEAGYQLTLVPVADVASAQKAIVGKRRRRTVARWGAAAAVVAVVGSGVAATVLLTGGSAHDNTLSAANLERAKRASVQIIAFDANDLPEWTGSGTVIDSGGLILTNAHVAKPTAKGLTGGGVADHDPSYLQVAFAKDDNTPAAAKYRATPVVSDGYLDLSVIRIDANADGSPLGSDKLALPEPVPIGDSNALQTGDHITALGYPGLTGDDHLGGPLTVTSGDVSAFKRDYGTNTERFWIDTTERIAHGNSGGASINSAGELIAVNTQFRKGQENEPAASYLVRPSALAADVLKVARDGGDSKYVSPYLAKIKHLPDEATATSAGWNTAGLQNGDADECGSPRNEDDLNHLTGVQPGDVVHANFLVTGVPDDTPFTVGFVDPKTNDILGAVDSVWIYGESSMCIGPPFEVPPGVSQVVAVIDIGYQSDLQVNNAVEFS